jgi:hypothetical protein
MRIMKSLIALALVASSPVMAASYTCGIFLNEDETPSVTFKYDTAEERVVARIGDYIGGVIKQEAGLVVVTQAAKVKITSVAYYKDSASLMVSILDLDSNNSATTVCQMGNAVALVRPNVSL